MLVIIGSNNHPLAFVAAIGNQLGTWLAVKFTLNVW
jgi:hypothetical protein